ncbi:MAG: hypothetical protein KJZ77_11620 [Anaerolineales bacterium]|nr:hypothetical protein [Anaerolineales bacterium]
MKTYHYSQDFRTKHRNYLSLFLSLSFFLVLVSIAVVDYQSQQEDMGVRWLIMYLAFIVTIYDLYQINLYPNINVGETGLGVEFLGFYIPVPWENVESILMIQSRYYPEVFTEWFVRTKKLTLFHLLYGKNKYGKFATGFLIRSEMESIQELLDKIGSKIPVNGPQSYQKTEYSD